MKNFKKTLAVLLSILMIMAIPMTAFAAPNSGTPIGSQYEQDAFVMEASYLSLDYSDEEPMWNYDEHTHRYTDNEGNVWRRLNDKNWIVSKENEQWMYQVLEDGTLYVISNPDIEIDQNLVIPSTLEGKTVTRVMDAGRGTTSYEYSPTLSITIPNTVIAIDHSAFRNVRKLKRVVIPTSVKSIEVEAFNLTDDIELYYCGTEEQWNDIVVWNHASTHDPTHWAVTDFDWLDMPFESGILSESAVKAVHFNVDPDTLEPLLPEEKPATSNSFFDQLLAGASSIVVTIVSFFKRIGDLIIQIF